MTGCTRNLVAPVLLNCLNTQISSSALSEIFQPNIDICHQIRGKLSTGCCYSLTRVFLFLARVALKLRGINGLGLLSRKHPSPAAMFILPETCPFCTPKEEIVQELRFVRKRRPTFMGQQIHEIRKPRGKAASQRKPFWGQGKKHQLDVPQFLDTPMGVCVYACVCVKIRGSHAPWSSFWFPSSQP